MDPSPTLPSRRRWPLAAGLAAAALIAVGLAVWLQKRPGEGTAAAEPFNLDTAMNLIGAEVPTGVESFYFFVLEAKSPTETSELAEKMVQAAGEHEFLGITGADPSHNRAVLLAALAVPRQQDLRGLIIIYAGPPEQETELREVVLKNGAEFRFVPYAPGPGETI